MSKKPKYNYSLYYRSFLMTDVQLMQQMLDKAITKIDELEERMDEIRNNPAALLEFRDCKKNLAIQQRVKITLIQSIQELTPTSTALIIPVKSSNSLLARVGNFFKRIFI
jgi:uncharacterized protein YlaI